jgi:hypothetical protein
VVTPKLHIKKTRPGSIAALTDINLIEVSEPDVPIKKTPNALPPITNGSATTAHSAMARLEGGVQES